MDVKISVKNMEEAKKVALGFKELMGTEAFDRLRRFVRLMRLQAGQEALMDPSKVEHLRSWSEGVSFILNVVEDTMKQFNVVEGESETDLEDVDMDVVDMLSIGSSPDAL